MSTTQPSPAERTPTDVDLAAGPVAGTAGPAAATTGPVAATAARSTGVVVRMRAIATRVRPVLSWTATVLSALLVSALLIVPGRPDYQTPLALLRIPLEGLLFLALLIAVRGRARAVLAALIGVAFGLWAVVRVVDVGFYALLARPFDPVHDWGFLDAGVGVVGRSHGPAAEVGAVVAAVVAALIVLVLVALAVVRLARVAARHQRRFTAVVAALSLVWVGCAVAGVQVVGGVPVAGRDYFERLAQVRASLWDYAAFAADVADDPYRDTPGDELLTALRGKDVVVVVVESYGRAALEHPEIAPDITAVLAEGRRRLEASGFASRSAFLTSPTFGGGSWLAQATLLCGVWVDNQQRYGDIAESGRLTLAGAFQRAGWRTVGIMPGVTQGWSGAPFQEFDEIREFQDLGYAGPIYSFDTMPDQYVLSYFERTEHAPAPREDLMAMIPLISSHAPWSPVPALVDWNGIGDGSEYAPPTEELVPAETVLLRDPSRVRSDYAAAIEYSLSSVISYVETYGDDDLVLLFLGDHQPVPVVTGETTNRDAPISIVTRDRRVLDRIADWGWRDGLVPDPGSPVWRMDDFRDRFLGAFR